MPYISSVKLGGFVHLIDPTLSPTGALRCLVSKINNDNSVNLTFLDESGTDADGNFLVGTLNNVPPNNVPVPVNNPCFIDIGNETVFLDSTVGSDYPYPIVALVLQVNSDGTKNLLVMDPTSNDGSGGKLSEVYTSVQASGGLTNDPATCFVVIQA